MRTTTYIISCITAVLLLAACKKAEELKYQEDPRVYFTKYVPNPDSIIYSFAVQPNDITTTTVPLTFRIMGTAVNRDRVINLQVDDSSTAKLGYHFTLGKLVIPAGQYQAEVPVTIYRKPGLKDSLLNAYFTVKESADFKPGYDDYTSSLIKKTRLQYKITVNDYLLKPTSWECCIAGYLGAYSATKFRFVILVTGKTSWDSGLDRTPGIMNFVTTTAKNALRDYEAANGPMLDENGQVITFP